MNLSFSSKTGGRFALFHPCLVMLVFVLWVPVASAQDIKEPRLKDPLDVIIPMTLEHLVGRDDVASVQIRISEEGRVIDWIPLNLPHYDLVDSIGKALQKARFSPAEKGGVPTVVDTIFEVPVGEGAVTSVLTQSFRSYNESFETWLHKVDPSVHQLVLTHPKNLDKPLRMTSRGQPKRVKDDDGNVLSGAVRVEFFIDPEGNAKLPRPVTDAHTLLQLAACKMVEDLKFDPPTRSGVPTVCKVQIPVAFPN
jgi:hypothetical protein